MHRTRHHVSDGIDPSFGTTIYGIERFTNSEKSYFQFKFLAIYVQILRYAALGRSPGRASGKRARLSFPSETTVKMDHAARRFA